MSGSERNSFAGPARVKREIFRSVETALANWSDTVLSPTKSPVNEDIKPAFITSQSPIVRAQMASFRVGRLKRKKKDGIEECGHRGGEEKLYRGERAVWKLINRMNEWIGRFVCYSLDLFDPITNTGEPSLKSPSRLTERYPASSHGAHRQWTHHLYRHIFTNSQTAEPGLRFLLGSAAISVLGNAGKTEKH